MTIKAPVGSGSPHPPRPGFFLCRSLGVWRSVRKTAEPGSFVAGLIRLSVYPSNTTRCRPPLRGVKGLRSHPRSSLRVFYAASCKRTSENSPSRNCPKRVGGACGVALRSISTALFDPFWPPYASQFLAQSVVRTPFRTVSEEEFSEVHRKFAKNTAFE